MDTAPAFDEAYNEYMLLQQVAVQLPRYRTRSEVINLVKDAFEMNSLRIPFYTGTAAQNMNRAVDELRKSLIRHLEESEYDYFRSRIDWLKDRCARSIIRQLERKLRRYKEVNQIVSEHEWDYFPPRLYVHTSVRIAINKSHRMQDERYSARILSGTQKAKPLDPIVDGNEVLPLPQPQSITKLPGAVVITRL
jgi:hypothetical protein